MLYVHGKQLRSCWDSQLLNHTVPGQASQRQFTSIVSILSPATDNLLFLNQRMREFFFHKRMCLTRGSIAGPLLAKRTGCRPSYRFRLIVQTQIRLHLLLLEEQSDHGIHCLSFHLHVLDEVSSDSLLTKLGIQDLDVVLRTGRMRWFGHAQAGFQKYAS